MVFIGSYIPHLNFDYGIKTECEKVVVQIRQDFLGNAFANIPELAAVYRLFEQSKHGVAFGKETKLLVGERLKNLKNLGHFEQFLEILSIFQVLAHSKEMELLHPKPVENQHNKKEQERLKRIYNFIDTHYQQKIEVEEIANLTNLSKSAFCRYFKKITRVTFVEFLNHYRINQAQKLLLLDKNITEACFESGFESLSYFNRTFKKITGENPLSFKKKFLNDK
jgi:AraC-like DNA-binding protein